ncbi:MAG: DUF3137 domain-containing protein [Candidatus Omnitrophota bacterium]
MKTVQELHEFYQTKLLADISILEKERIKVANKLFKYGIIVGGIALLLTGVVFYYQARDLRAYIVPGAVGMAIYGMIYNWQTKNYKCDFKLKIIQKIVGFIDPQLKYDPYSCIPQQRFKFSGIFRHSIDKYRGDDLVCGVLGKTKIEFSEICAEYETRDNKGNRHTHTIFKGLFFIADFNKDFQGTTYVLPDKVEKIFGGLGAFLQKADKRRGELVKLEDAVFEKAFVVYAEDQIEARYILSPSLMARILDFKKKTNKDIYLSFIKSNVYVAIPYGKDLFEPQIFKTLNDFNPIKEYYEDLVLAVSIVDDLNLNTRIWTKK